ncbi:MAG: HEAT repeat domain-containing protein [Desulfatibacillaceae bacterium]|nr:HEAT repeat domain-containing protein [Desulfatibacillaceae bacterium]
MVKQDDNAKIRGRALKKQVLSLIMNLEGEHLEKALEDFEPRRVASPLIGLLCSGRPPIRWKAVAALGFVTDRLASQKPESAREIMRRFLWQMNEESGGIGWGVPEAMGEAMARNPMLANEFGSILVSYLAPGGNYLEHDPIRAAVVWGIGRMAQTRPEIAAPAKDGLLASLTSNDRIERAYAAWALAQLGEKLPADAISRIVQDKQPVTIMDDGRILELAPASLAEAKDNI